MGFFVNKDQSKVIKLLEKPDLVLEQTLANLCKQQGQQILFLYESELKDVEKLKKKVLDFHNLLGEQFKLMYEQN